MDKKLFVRQNPKDFAKGGFYLSFQKSFKRLIGITGFFLLFLFFLFDFSVAGTTR